MLFEERLKLKTLLRKITERKEYIKEFWESYCYGLFSWMPEWDFGHEIANDRNLNQLYFEMDKIIKQSVDRDMDYEKSLLSLAK